jgi:hypothetical protein
MVSNATSGHHPDAPSLPISRTLRLRGTRQNVSTDHLRQNVGPSRHGDRAPIYASVACQPTEQSAPIAASGRVLAKETPPHYARFL